MNVLIVFAHPEPKSMNGLLKNKAIEVIKELGLQYKLSDLYAIDFPASVSKKEFPFYQAEFFDLQQAQAEAENLDQQPGFIKVEQEKLRWADVVVFSISIVVVFGSSNNEKLYRQCLFCLVSHTQAILLLRERNIYCPLLQALQNLCGTPNKRVPLNNYYFIWILVPLKC